MAFLTTAKQWVEKIWRVELDTRWAGGEDGTANIQAKQLAARTEFLKDFADEVEAARESESSLLARIKKTGVEPMKIIAKFAFIQHTPVAASTEDVDVNSGGLMEMDGVWLNAGDLAFLKDQADKKQNGFWEVHTGAWNRFPGYQGTDNDCFAYKFIFIKAGAANKGKVFFLDKDVYEIGVDELEFKESLFSPDDIPGTILLRDQEGRSNEDHKLDYGLTTHGDMIEGYSRSLLDVFGVKTIAEAMAEIRRRCNNNGEIDGSGRPDFRGIRIGDYIDLPSLDDGATVYTWNPDYKNLRILVSGFNHYKNAGDTENTQNHILFTFRNCPLTKRMNATETNEGGYVSSELWTYLEGVFMLALKTPSAIICILFAACYQQKKEGLGIPVQCSFQPDVKCGDMKHMVQMIVITEPKGSILFFSLRHTKANGSTALASGIGLRHLKITPLAFIMLKDISVRTTTTTVRLRSAAWPPLSVCGSTRAY